MRVSDFASIGADGLKQKVTRIAVHEDKAIDSLRMVEVVSDGELDSCRPASVNNALIGPKDVAEKSISHL